ncbi:MAG: hypothetical protein H6816_03135 [Phycisphaerales bacterium]|nr:hypothetical protein [Phycisphaerales bacterium]
MAVEQCSLPPTVTGVCISRYAVAIAGNTAQQSVRFRLRRPNQSGGAAYFFRKDGGSWRQQAKLVPFDNTVPDLFGFSVGMSRNTLIMGAPQHRPVQQSGGAAYIYALASDCNINESPDECEIAAGLAADCNADGVLDMCGIVGDVNADGYLDREDASMLIACLGGPEASVTTACCLSDLDTDNDVDLRDFARFARLIHGSLLGDLDGDGDVDTQDYVLIAGCLGGPNTNTGDPCHLADFDRDGDTDLADFAELQRLLATL